MCKTDKSKIYLQQSRTLPDKNVWDWHFIFINPDFYETGTQLLSKWLTVFSPRQPVQKHKKRKYQNNPYSPYSHDIFAVISLT